MNSQNNLIQFIRAKYQEKRSKKKWINRKRNNSIQRFNQLCKERQWFEKGTINCVAPADFSFVNNTEEVVKYFNQIRKHIDNDQPVKIDISNITNLSPDIIILLIAVLKEKKSMKVGISGNAPKIPHLKKIFVESGLYNFVTSRGKKKVADNNKLWKHSTNNQVKGEIAGETVNICRELFAQNGIKYDTDNLYNLLVEAMSNTINHADKEQASINWWFYYFIDTAEQTIKFSFIDLGIGIFRSASFDSYRKYLKTLIPGNSFLVKPFLEGKIISSRKKDHEISGKGIKQIMSCAQNKEFINFTIITNDQKINIKEKNSDSINTNFDGTFINFEISYKNINNGNKI
ncbi:hypothetical protein [Capnocytophaga cynodegmi]|uniref:hypothetical protein n=1 Tax=Capnocytophaga cynodegmi TaxID=28189 RepID=UPI001BB31A0D|nr:hypothetical protein [Capnocytophaga cynodegmi]